VAPNWAGRWNEDDDWAIIGTDHPAANRVGWFGYQAYDNGYPDGLILNVSGYPADSYGANAELATASLAGSGFQYMDSGYLSSTTPTEIAYTISTAEGMSGSPVFITPGSSRFAIGIHTQGRVTTNAGRRIDNQLLGILNSYWAR
jgi:V8-like Glu-specific endopeptidase